MALEYFLYRTDFDNTLVDRGATSFAPLPPNTGEIFINFFIPENQPLYFYKELTGSIVLNDDQTIDDYLEATTPISPDSSVEYGTFTGYTAQTETRIQGIESDILYLSGQTGGGTVVFEYKFESGVSAPPSAKHFILNNANITLATRIYIDKETNNSVDLSILLLSIETGAQIYIQRSDDSTEAVLYNVTDNPTDNGTYVTIKVSYESSSVETSFTDNKICGIIINQNTTNNVKYDIYTGYTASTEVRLSGIEDDIVYISGQTGAGSLSGLTDVHLSGLTNNDFITYNTGTTKWENIKSETFISEEITDTVNNGEVLYLSGSTLRGIPLSQFGITGISTTRMTFPMGVSSISPIISGNKGRYMFGYSGKIIGWTLITDQQTTIVLDVWKSNNTIPTVANSIFGTKPSLSNGEINSAYGLNISVSQNDVFILNVDSNDNAKYLKLDLLIEIN